MQPALTLYSGVHADHTLLKFCSEECKNLWFHKDGQGPFHVVSYLDEVSLSKKNFAPLMTIIIAKEKSVEQIYLCVSKISEDSLEAPFIVWHVRELKNQFFAHFYISKDCLPLKAVWTRHICGTEIETISDVVAKTRVQLQSTFQVHFNQAIKKYSFSNFESFVIKGIEVRSLNEVSLLQGKLLISYLMNSRE